MTTSPRNPNRASRQAGGRKRNKPDAEAGSLAEKAKSGRERYAFVIPKYDPDGSDADADASCVARELAERGKEILVVAKQGTASHEHVTVRRSNPLIMGRKAIKAFDPACIVDWGYNMPADVRRVSSPYEQLLRHTAGACSGLHGVLKRVQFRFSKEHREHVHKQRILLRVSKTVFVAESELVADDLKRAGVASNRIRVVPYGVDLGRFSEVKLRDQRCALRRALGFSEKHVVCLTVADDPHLVDVGQLTNTAEAAHAQQKNLRLWHVGDFDPKWKAPWLLHTGWEHSTAAIFAAADVLVHPAVYDPSARMVIQTMAAGIPVVTTEAIGSADFVKESGGALVLPSGPADHPADWQEAILHVAKDEKKRRELGEKGRKAAAKRPLSAFVDQLEEILATR